MDEELKWKPWIPLATVVECLQEATIWRRNFGNTQILFQLQTQLSKLELNLDHLV